MHSVFKQIKAKQACLLTCVLCYPLYTSLPSWVHTSSDTVACVISRDSATSTSSSSSLHPPPSSTSHESFVPGVRVQTMNAMLRVSAGQPRVLCGKWEWAPVCVLTRKWSGPLLPAAAHFSNPDIDTQHWWRFCGNASQQMRRFCDYHEFRCTSKHRCHNSIVVLENTTCYWWLVAGDWWLVAGDWWLVGNCGSYSIWLASCSHQHTCSQRPATLLPQSGIFDQ